MFLMRRSSTLIRSNRRARLVLAFSAQSFRRSVSRAFNRAMASRTRPRRFEPCRVRTSLRSNRRMRLRSRAVRPSDVQQLPGRQRRRHRHTPIDAHDLLVAWREDRVGDDCKGDMPAPGPVHAHPIGPGPRRHRAGPAEPHPTRLRHPYLAGLPAQPPDMPGPDRDDPEPLVAPGLAPARPPSRVARVEERGHRLGEVPQRLLLDDLRACGQPRVLRPGFGELSALLQVSGSARPARAPVRVLLHGQVPHVPGMAAVGPQYGLLGGRRDQSVPRHTNTLSATTDISGGVKRRSISSLKARVSTPRS